DDADKDPINGTLLACCASAEKQIVTSKAYRNRLMIFLFMFFSAFGPLVTRRLTLMPCHLMTWFALAKSSGESASPICFAAFKLITNSNFVACCTGKSAGLAPFKILST